MPAALVAAALGAAGCDTVVAEQCPLVGCLDNFVLELGHASGRCRTRRTR